MDRGRKIERSLPAAGPEWSRHRCEREKTLLVAETPVNGFRCVFDNNNYSLCFLIFVHDWDQVKSFCRPKLTWL